MRGVGWLWVQWYEGGPAHQILNDAWHLRNFASANMQVPNGPTIMMRNTDVLDACWIHNYGPNPNLYSGDEMLLLGDTALVTGDPFTPAPGTGQLMAFVCESVDGFPTTYSRSINQRAWRFGGASFTRRRPNHLAITYVVSILATSEPGLNAGLANLTGMLMGPDGCSKGRFWLADECGPSPLDGDYAQSATWRIEGGSLLDAPRWVEPVSAAMDCFVRRCQFTLGAEDGHLYRRPQFDADSALVAPDPAGAGGCFTWEQYFCNEEAVGPLTYTYSGASPISPPLRQNESLCLILEIYSGTSDETAPVVIRTTRNGEAVAFRTLPIPVGRGIRFDGSRHRATEIESTGGAEIGDGSAFIDGAYGSGPGWPEVGWWDLMASPLGVGFDVFPGRVCFASNTNVTSYFVIRAG